MGDAKKTYQLLPCKTEDYERYTVALNKIFNKKEDSWFIKYMPNIFPEVGDESREHLIPSSMYFLDDNEIMSTIGIYPLQMQISYGDKSAVLGIGGIGSVGTVAEYRGMGLMSQMLNQVNKKMYDDGYDISWLGGDRYRYKNYGWDLSGRVAYFAVNLRDLKRLYDLNTDCQLIEGGIQHIDILESLYSGYSTRVLRDKSTWQSVFNRKGSKISILMDNDENAKSYMIYIPQSPENIGELQGEANSIVDMLMKHMQKNDLDRVVIEYPYNDDDTFKLLSDICAGYRTENGNQIKVVNVESTWEKLKPIIKEQVKDIKCDGLLEVFNRIETNEEKRAILDITFGKFDILTKLPESIDKLKVLKPLSWWLPKIDYV